jgi:chromate transporter
VVLLVLTLGSDQVFARLAIFFSQMAVVTFGGAYAVLAYVAQAAAETYAWVSPEEMLDGLGMAETTPGPLIQVVQFVGFLAAFRDPGQLDPYLSAILASILVTWVTFTPSFLWIFLGAPHIERLRGNHALASALSAITAAVVGVILNLALWFALHVLFAELRPIEAIGLDFDMPVPASLDPAAAVLVAMALVAAFRFKMGVMPLLAGAAGLGALWRLAALG